MRMMTWLAVALLMEGCVSSAPLRFYTLSPIPPASPTTAAHGTAIRVARVRVPPELDRNEIVQRMDANQLRIGEQDRWAAPLDEMIRRVLAADLQARGGRDGATLSVDIQELIGDLNCEVSLIAAWELKGAETGGVGGEAGPTGSADRAPHAHALGGREVIRVPAPAASPCPASALPALMSQALAELADRIVAARR
jgi:uncharacterized protein